MHSWRILLDLDGTVAQNAGRTLAQRHFGVAITEERYADSLLDILGITSEQFWAWWDANQEEIYGQAAPLPGARETLQLLKDAGAYIAVVTARRANAEAVTTAWLARHGFPYDTMVMAADDKLAVARALGLNIGFEDDPAHAVPLADHMPMLLIDNFKNRRQEIVHPQIHRLAGWSEALPFMHRLAAKTA